MWDLDCKESWVPKNWCFWTVVLEKTLESPLDCKEIKPVYPKGNQSWTFIWRTDAEAETRILGLPDAKNWLNGKDPDAGKNWSQEEKGTTEDEMVGWHHQLDGHEFEKALGVGDGQGSLACCSPWGCKESDMTEPPNWTEQPGSRSQKTVRFSRSWHYFTEGMLGSKPAGHTSWVYVPGERCPVLAIGLSLHKTSLKNQLSHFRNR